MSGRPADVRAWLRTNPSLAELKAAYPSEWAPVERDIGRLVASGDYDGLATMTAVTARGSSSARRRATSRQDEHALICTEVRRQMTVAALRQVRVALATGVDEGKVRFNLVNGWLLQRLLFKRGLERKPASMFWFRLVWPLCRQRRYLMALVQPKGIYCFYSKQLIRSLAAMVSDAKCLEIAAGDGTLTRFLAAEGIDIMATDDYSWNERIEFPDSVRRLDARKALAVHQPEVVICSWPPASNAFEREVFKTKSVRCYIVIGTRDRQSAGNWTAYDAQREFDFDEHAELSRLVLPPELQPVVYVFRRSSRG